MRALAKALLLSLVFVGCGAPSGAGTTVGPNADANAATARPPLHGTFTYVKDGVSTYVSSGWGFSTASYVIEGPTGLVVIDTEFLPSAAEELVNDAESATHKQVLLAIVLHPNPDKFNGTDVMRKHGAKVVTSEEVLAKIPAVFAQRTRAFRSRYAPDWPEATPLPDSFGAADTDLSAGGVTVRAHVLGAGCSEAHVVVEWSHEIFPGDLVANRSHSWLELGLTPEWLKRLDEMRAMHPTKVHPGRGPSGGPELLDAETKYLNDAILAVAHEQPTPKVDDAGIARAKKTLTDEYPGYDFDMFLDIGLPAEWARQAKTAPFPVDVKP
ncbi:MAG TPA: MBL fold metallo-hydrolase [Polyangiaceae bacterium]